MDLGLADLAPVDLGLGPVDLAPVDLGLVDLAPVAASFTCV